MVALFLRKKSRPSFRRYFRKKRFLPRVKTCGVSLLFPLPFNESRPTPPTRLIEGAEDCSILSFSGLRFSHCERRVDFLLEKAHHFLFALTLSPNKAIALFPPIGALHTPL